MKKEILIILSLLMMTLVSCGNSEKTPKYANENEAAIGLIKEAQPELSNDMMRVIEKADRHDGGGSHLGYNMLVYNERIGLYLPIIIIVFPTENVPSLSKNLRTDPYNNPRYDSDVKPNSEWITHDQVVIKKNIFNGDTEYWE